MRNDGVRDLHLAVAWSCRQLEKIRAAGSHEEVGFWFVPNTADEMAPPLADQQLALEYLKNSGAITISNTLYLNELYNRVGAPEMFGAKPDGYSVQIASREFEKVCKELRPLMDKLGVYLVRADLDFSDLKQPTLIFENQETDAYAEFNGERVHIKPHTRQFGLLTALKEQRGRHLSEAECIEEANRYVAEGKRFTVGKQLHATLDDIKKNLKVGKSSVFPIERLNNGCIWRR